MVDNGFTHIPGSNQAEITEATVYVFVKSDVNIDRLNKKSDVVKSALVHDDYVYKIKMLSYQMDGSLPDFQKESFGPHQEEN